jgi:hypothetical protein
LESLTPVQELCFPPPWSVEELDACFVVRDHNGQQLAYVEDELGRRSAARLLTRDEARRIAVRARCGSLHQSLPLMPADAIELVDMMS